MSGYAMVYGACYGCGRLFSFSPTRVPSIRVNGSREPVCQSCVELASMARAAKGLPAITILDGAYEAVPEGELA